MNKQFKKPITSKIILAGFCLLLIVGTILGTNKELSTNGCKSHGIKDPGNCVNLDAKKGVTGHDN